MSQPIPGLAGSSDSVKVGYGNWHGNLVGNDTVNFDENDAFTLIGGGGNDKIVSTATAQIASIKLGNGSDTIFDRTGEATVHLGNGRDSVHFSDGQFSIVLGDGNDTVAVSTGAVTVVAGGGNDKINVGS